MDNNKLFGQFVGRHFPGLEFEEQAAVRLGICRGFLVIDRATRRVQRARSLG